MATIVGVQFQKNGKIYNFEVNNLEVKPDDYVIADTNHGIDLGQVVVGCRHVEETDSAVALKKLIRIATEKDLQNSADNREKEREAFSVCQKKIAEHKLDMKLVSVEYAFDNSKALFYFTANGRVDFRSLVKDLASVFKMRIELRQIGVRDEARMIGGLGPCGRQICCGSFLDEFQPVSIKMAKEQKLSLNPTKISGVCGRLMCCLKYEEEQYEGIRKRMPKVGKEFQTPEGTATVIEQNILKECVACRLCHGDTSEIKEYSLDELTSLGIAKPYVQEELSKDSANDPGKVIACNEEANLPSEKSKEDSEGKTEKTAECNAFTAKECEQDQRNADLEMPCVNEPFTDESDGKAELTPGKTVDTKPMQSNEKAKAKETSKVTQGQRADLWRAALEKAIAAANSKT